MGIIERHWFEDEEPELTDRQLEDIVYENGYVKGFHDARTLFGVKMGFLTPEKKEFIVSYAPGWCNIAAALIDKNMKEMYDFITNRHKIEEKTILPYNNQFWGSVMAKNSKEAFDIFYEQFKKEWP